jgi:hypothetical protein
MNIACDSGGETSVVHRFEHEREARRLDRVKLSSCVCGPEPRDVVLLMGLIEPPLASPSLRSTRRPQRSELRDRRLCFAATLGAHSCWFTGES